jgi:hypothetical protein
LKSNAVVQYLALGVLLLLMLALLAGVRTIQPRAYDFPEADLTRMRQALHTILTFKARWMRAATWLLCIGAGLLAVLIASSSSDACLRCFFVYKDTSWTFDDINHRG